MQEGRERKRSRRVLAIVAAAALAAGVVGGVSALESTQTGTIYACKNKTSGLVRIVSETTTCFSSELAVRWNVVGPPGEDGQDGEDGAPGEDGATWRSGAGAPDDSLGADGDFYLDTSTGDAYKRGDGDYTKVASLTGPAGKNGEDGTDGIDGTDGADGTDGYNGNLWQTGLGPPSSGIPGAPNDLYLDRSTGDVYRFTFGGTWGETPFANIKGQKGDKGDKGDRGPAVSASCGEGDALRSINEDGSSSCDTNGLWNVRIAYSDLTLPGGANTTGRAYCDPGEVVLGGGVEALNRTNSDNNQNILLEVMESFPRFDGGVGLWSWRTGVINESGVAADVRFRAVCAST